MTRRDFLLGLVAAVVVIALGVPVGAQAPAPARLQDLGDTTITTSATVIRVADNTRIRMVCTNTHATVHARWGRATVTAARGAQLRAGATVEIFATGIIYMAAESGTIVIACTEELR